MTIFFTSSVHHLSTAFPGMMGSYTWGSYSNGEFWLQLNQEVNDQQVWVIAAVTGKPEGWFELFFLLDALCHSGAHVHLLVTYFGYARQDKVSIGRAAGSKIMATFLSTFKLEKIYILHAHGLLKQWLSFEDIIPFELLCSLAGRYDAVIAPDNGMRGLISQISDYTGIKPIFCHKTRINGDILVMVEGNLTSLKKVLIIDDIFDTGTTAIQVARMIAQVGVAHIDAWTTHGIFSGSAFLNLEKSPIQKLFVTNSLSSPSLAVKGTDKLVPVDIIPGLQKIMEGGSEMGLHAGSNSSKVYCGIK